MEEKPNYYAIIPAEVRYDNDLRAGAKLFYGEITALCSKNGFCSASNNYFAELYKITPSCITHWVTQLKNKGYINVEYDKCGKEIKQRRIYIIPFDTPNKTVKSVMTNINTVLTKVDEGIDKNTAGYLQKDKENNTSNNNTSNNNNINNINIIYKEKNKSSIEIFESLIGNYRFNPGVIESIREWFTYKQEKKEKYTETGVKSLLKQLEKHWLKYGDAAIINLIDESMGNNYKGICFDKLKYIKEEDIDPYAGWPHF